jgi:hypothetical protein
VITAIRSQHENEISELSKSERALKDIISHLKYEKQQLKIKINKMEKIIYGNIKGDNKPVKYMNKKDLNTVSGKVLRR